MIVMSAGIVIAFRLRTSVRSEQIYSQACQGLGDTHILRFQGWKITEWGAMNWLMDFSLVSPISVLFVPNLLRKIYAASIWSIGDRLSISSFIRSYLYGLSDVLMFLRLCGSVMNVSD